MNLNTNSQEKEKQDAKCFHPTAREDNPLIMKLLDLAGSEMVVDAFVVIIEKLECLLRL